MRYLLLVFITSALSSKLPILFVHGFGDSCTSPAMLHHINFLKESLRTQVHCFEIGIGKLTSYFRPLEDQAIELCSKVMKSVIFDGDFNILALSQGGLIARHLFQNCQMKGVVRRMILWNTPNRGIAAVPQMTCGFFCNIINALMDRLFYFDFMLKNFSPASFYNGRYSRQKYRDSNTFLKKLNNETSFNKEVYDKYSKLERFILIKSLKDYLIIPQETTVFEFYDQEGKEIVHLEQSEFYTNDILALRKLNSEGKLKLCSWNTQHVEYDEYSYYQDVISNLE